jgi:hypothetical protein
VFRTCRETDLLHRQPGLFPVIVLFVRENTDYRWVEEAHRVAGKKMLIVVRTKQNPSLSAHQGEFPTMDDVFRPIPFRTVPTDAVTDDEEEESEESRGREKRRVSQKETKRTETRRRGPRRRHQVIVAPGPGVPQPSSLERLQVYFESKLPVHRDWWSKDPKFRLSKEGMVFRAFCAGGCGSAGNNIPIYEMDVETGAIIQLMDEKIKKHGQGCLAQWVPE